MNKTIKKDLNNTNTVQMSFKKNKKNHKMKINMNKKINIKAKIELNRFQNQSLIIKAKNKEVQTPILAFMIVKMALLLKMFKITLLVITLLCNHNKITLMHAVIAPASHSSQLTAVPEREQLARSQEGKIMIDFSNFYRNIFFLLWDSLLLITQSSSKGSQQEDLRESTVPEWLRGAT